MSWFSSFFNPGNPAAGPANAQIGYMEQQQAQHDSAVKQGKSAIDTAFQQFTPDYFNGVSTAYENAYNPQLTDQYNVAKDKMIGALAGGDQLEGSTGAYQMGQLDKTYGTARANIANSATDAANSMRTTVNNAKSNLYSLNEQTADPLTMATQAQASSGAIVAPQAYPQLSNVFGDALNSAAVGMRANAGSMSPYYGYGMGAAPGGYAPIGGAGSSSQSL